MATTINTTGGTTQTTASGRSYVTNTTQFGVDTQALITAEVTAKLAPATKLSAQITTDTTKITAYQKLQTLSNALTSSISNLTSAASGTNNPLKQQTASISASDGSNGSGILSATVSSTASNVSHSIIVQKIAQPESITSTSQGSATAALGYTGVFNIGLSGGGSSPITVGPTDTLQTIATSINNTTGTSGVSASVVPDISGGFTLVLTGTTPDKTITTSVTSGTDVLQSLGVTDNVGAFPNIAQPAQAAKISVDGTVITSPTNTVTGAISGVTLNLNSANPGITINLGVVPDTSGVGTAVKNFITAYNALNDFITSNEKVNADGTVSSSSPLFGDGTLRSVSSALSSAISGSYGNASLISIGALGISLDSNNDLSITDQTTFNNQLASNLSGVQALFATNVSKGTKGLADTLYNAISAYSQPGGIIDGIVNQLQSTDTTYTNQVAQIQSDAATYRTQLINRYSKLETLSQNAQISLQKIQAISGQLYNTNNN